MSTMTFFADRAARTNKVTGDLNLASLTEMVPVLVAALVAVLTLNLLV
ncbi:hypothetical protein [Niveispirillum sp.]|nr:hypothetical protein [Niveispirillum sp.]MBP7338216.1 hypothetical protein [Niveispirillum sp.]